LKGYALKTYDPDTTFSQLLKYRRYIKIEKELKMLCPRVNFRDYVWTYGQIDWKNKVVLDIGGTIGARAIFFLLNGAKFVYLIDENPKYKQIYEGLKNMPTSRTYAFRSNEGFFAPVKFVKVPTKGYLNGILRNSSFIDKKDIPKDIDVLVLDCETCEYVSSDSFYVKCESLLTDDLIKRAKEFVVALYSINKDNIIRIENKDAEGKTKIEEKKWLYANIFEQKRKLLEKYGGKHYGSRDAGNKSVWVKKI
jgi:hypothetical protein